ncbi:aromatic amino acid lyase [Streptomyces sp. CA-252508]|uniref:aromatic amino acid lyase n=1 Tax=Streptomyces sp. CA-252508 TaxID=3418946 RepID=UPI003D8DB509
MVDVLGCRTDFTAPELFERWAQGHASQAAAAARHLEGHRPSGQRPLQEPYTLRCAPQLMGAAASSLRPRTPGRHRTT